jgi:hypothetical protein
MPREESAPSPPPLKVGKPEESRGVAEIPDESPPEPRASRSRRSKVTAKAEAGQTTGRRLYLSESTHFRLRLYAYQKGVKLSEAAEELLDKALPKWDVNRIG